jgi:drug/metabolite transporter (DMT)-like permease
MPADGADSEARPRAAGHAAHRPGLAIAMMLAAMLAFAAMDGVSKILGQIHAIPQILWVRYILFTIFVAILLRRRGLARSMASGQPWLQLARALLIVVENGIFVLAFLYMPLADVHAIAAASPLIVVALSVPMLGERVGPRRWLAVLAGFAGVLLIVRPGFVKLEWPVLIPIAGALMWGLYQVLVRMCARTDSGETTWAWSAIVGLAATTLVGPFVWTWPDAYGWSLLVAVAVLGSLAHYALIKALEFWEAGALQPFSYTLLVWAAVIGYLLFGHIPDAWTFAGAFVIILSGLYAWHRERMAGQARASATAASSDELRKR